MNRRLRGYALLTLAALVSVGLCLMLSSRIAFAGTAQPGHAAPRDLEPGRTATPSHAVEATQGHAPDGRAGASSAHDPHDPNAENAHEHGPGDINWADFSNTKQPPFAAVVINFGLLMLIYVRAGKKPVADALKSRKETIAKEIEEAAKQKRAAEERAKKYQASLGNLDADLSATKHALEEAGKNERDRLIADAQEKAVRMKKDAAFLVDQELRQAELDLTKEAALMAFAHADTLLARDVSESDHDRLVAEFLEELALKPAASAKAGVEQTTAAEVHS
jgi:F-type H+-transporting ATPase subunit b